jgi:hypothetical protein
MDRVVTDDIERPERLSAAAAPPFARVGFHRSEHHVGRAELAVVGGKVLCEVMLPIAAATATVRA